MTDLKPIFIAEIKTQSPYGYKARYGDWVSVHTNALWGGDFEAVSFVRHCTDKPILAKGLHGTDDEIQRALDHGADYVLVVNRIPADKYLDKCLLEPGVWFKPLGVREVNSKELKYVCNSRCLLTGCTYVDFELRLEALREKAGWLCQASNIITAQDVKPGMDAYLVGTHLTEFADRMEHLKVGKYERD
jgi:hypothetical protein